MSLRDQLIAKGLASKKDGRRVEQELRDKQRHEQGSRKRASALAAAQKAAARDAEERALRLRAEARQARAQEREAEERRNQFRQIVRGNQVRSRGSVRFHFRALDARSIKRMELSERVAWTLRAGEAAIVALVEDDRPHEYVVVSVGAARRLEELRPGCVVFVQPASTSAVDPADGLWRPEQEISLRPHRLGGPDPGPGFREA
jgi:uncharacterized protein YaiL (DUF2058 family)